MGKHKNQSAPNIDLSIDVAYTAIDEMDSPLVQDVFRDKYAYGEGETFEGMCTRVSEAIMARDGYAGLCYQAMQNRLWMPAGRILAGAGTPKRVTLLNCFVNSTIEDDMVAITQGVTNIMLTQQQGGGIGTDFSPLRPPNALLRRTGSYSSGPGYFMDLWDAACKTIRSAGDRRGAMMGTMRDSHPFLPEFIKAKQTKGKWENFNVSILVSDAFMAAVEEEQEWLLYHEAEPYFVREQRLVDLDFVDDDGVRQYVYDVWHAPTLWDEIIRGTYVFAEPGVIFIDRVNDENNLAYCEEIRCTNPCGEQPLPPHGCCDLGAVVISRMVIRPFQDDAEFNWDLLKHVVAIGTRFLDNVIDITNYPLEEQRREEFNKRRVGVGVSGLADAMHMLGHRYGSPASIRFAERVMQTIAHAAYQASTELAEEKGKFPLCDIEALLERPFIKRLPDTIRARIAHYGLRNGVLLTIAPTGTTSIAYGNGSAGLEPVFAHSMRRKVRQPDNSWLPYVEVSYGAKLWLALNPGATLEDLPAFMNECSDVRIHEHIRIQEVCQHWVDASISKTINVPEDISYEDFKDVYRQAYEAGCKGCTTYRPSDVRGSILDIPTEDAPMAEPGRPLEKEAQPPVSRGEIIDSRTIKISWPGLASSLYLTVGYVDGKPYEVFFNSKDQKSLEWTMALTILMSKSLRKGIPLEELCDEFQQIQALEGGWAPNNDGKNQYWPSLLSYLGYKVSQLSTPPEVPFKMAIDFVPGLYTATLTDVKPVAEPGSPQGEKLNGPRMTQCSSCHQYAVSSFGGCETCTNCGASKCA